MRAVLVTQRVDVLADRNERRDALDQRLVKFLLVCGFLPIPVPNEPDAALAIERLVQPEGIVLSGGNDLISLGGNAPERDLTEEILVRRAEENRIPVVGVCRGLQFLTARAGGKLARIEGHVVQRHTLHGTVARDVNSYHSWGLQECGVGWEAMAATADGFVELACCVERRQSGIMWHPEREPQFSIEDVVLFRQLLNVS
jgi:gamma-glutamyl-gamma-aminobutyrate hydrolase PuuD